MLNELIYRCMGNLKYFSLLMAAGMFAACSDNLENAGNGNEGPKTGEGYVKVAINTPSVSSSRAAFDDSADGTLVDGTSDEYADEYAVDNAILVFFKGTTESDATFEKAYALTSANLSVSGSNETPQVTEQVSVITEAPKVEEGKQLYVLAILNYDSRVLNVKNGSLIITNGPTLTGAYKLSELQKKISAAIDDTNKTNDTFLSYFTGSDKKKFTMTNAPLSDKSGSSSSITNAKAYTLVPVKVYDTKAQATAGEVANIYVERVVAKVTLKSSVLKSSTTNQIEVTNDAGDPTGDIVEITGWCLNVTNNSTKLVRDVNGFSNSGWLNTTPAENKPKRFAGTKVINASFGVESESGYYRIYWAQDCNYYATGGTDATTVNTDFTTYTSSKGAFSPKEPTWQTQLSTTTADNACYCLENTMNFTEQKDDRTTGVLIRTNYWTKFDGEDEATKKTFFICGTSSTKYPGNQVTGGVDGKTTNAFVDQIIAQANDLITNDGYKLATTGAKGLSIKTDLKSGTYTDVTDVFTFAEIDTNSKKYKAQLAAVQAAVGGRISCYINGENFYYSSLIRHFYDDEGVSVPSTGIASADEYKLQHLGRYGVVRNNWYEIDIQSISGPGTPDVEAPEGNTDDTTEGYINCSINVLSWAKRQQSVDL